MRSDLALLAAFAATTVLAGVSSVHGTSANVHRRVYRRLEEAGRANIVVTMHAPAVELSRALQLDASESHGERIASLTEKMQAHAETSQKPIERLLSKEATHAASLFQTQHRSWILNARFFQGATLAWVEALAQLPEVAGIREEELVEVDREVSRDLTAAAINESAVQWGVDLVKAPLLWARGINGSGVVVGSIDSGVRGTHQLLSANFRKDYGWFSPGDRSSSPRDLGGHGTHTVGTMVGSGGIGVAPGAQWIACQACATTCTEAAIVQCTEWMLCPTDTNGYNKDCSKAPHVINNSWSTRSGSKTHQPIIDAWVAAGIVPVFSNGNEGPACGSVRAPGEYDNVISVGNIASDGFLARLSSRGPSPSGTVKPDISAPGQLIASASYLDDQSLRVISGTSMAAPHVAGAVALLLSAKPDLTVPEIREALLTSAHRSEIGTLETSCDTTGVASLQWPNNNYGHGILDIHTAFVKLGLYKTPTPTPTQQQPAACALELGVDLVGISVTHRATRPHIAARSA